MEPYIVNVNSESSISDNNDIKRLKYYQYFLIYFISFLLFIPLVIYTIMEPDKNMNKLLYKKLSMYSIVIFLSWLNGKIFLEYYKMKVNYTRKINHIIVWSIPFTIDKLIDVPETNLSILWNIILIIIGHVLWMIPSREFDKTGFLNTCYSTIDRPEDRPNTLLWLVLQTIGAGITILPFGFLWQYWDVSDYLFVPLIILTFGDGFAEIIGVKYGKHKYKVSALCTDTEYTRSYEGSFCVYLSGIIIICLLYSKFKFEEFLINIILVPFIGMFSEAFSPHTLDNPMIILSTSTVLSLTHLIFI